MAKSLLGRLPRVGPSPLYLIVSATVRIYVFGRWAGETLLCIFAVVLVRESRATRLPVARLGGIPWFVPLTL